MKGPTTYRNEQLKQPTRHRNETTAHKEEYIINMNELQNIADERIKQK